jgi:tRNA1Val (adenine37-N6)-methyltransferase
VSGGDLTRDAFLGGRLHVWQPKQGYRAGTDPVFLAAACPAQAGDSVLELGCGVGVASLCLGARVSGLTLTGIERQGDYAALARRNAEEAGLKLEVVEADIARFRSHFGRCPSTT